MQRMERKVYFLHYITLQTVRRQSADYLALYAYDSVADTQSCRSVIVQSETSSRPTARSIATRWRVSGSVRHSSTSISCFPTTPAVSFHWTDTCSTRKDIRCRYIL